MSVKLIRQQGIVPFIRTYVEEGATPKPGSLNNEEYAKAQPCFPLIAIDILLYNSTQRKVYLAPRNIEPMKGELWFIGGRIRFAQSEADAAVAVFKRETKQVLNPARLEYWGACRYIYQMRELEPQDVGTDALGFNFGLDVSEEEMRKIGEGLDPSEYKTGEGLTAFTLAELEGKVQPVVLEMAEWALHLEHK